VFMWWMSIEFMIMYIMDMLQISKRMLLVDMMVYVPRYMYV
jgi:hypothetical protein